MGSGAVSVALAAIATSHMAPNWNGCHRDFQLVTRSAFQFKRLRREPPGTDSGFKFWVKIRFSPASDARVLVPLKFKMAAPAGLSCGLHRARSRLVCSLEISKLKRDGRKVPLNFVCCRRSSPVFFGGVFAEVTSSKKKIAHRLLRLTNGEKKKKRLKCRLQRYRFASE